MKKQKNYIQIYHRRVCQVPPPPLYSEDKQQNYRLTKISEIQKELKIERDKRRALYKKYHRGINVLDGVDGFLLTSTIATSAGGAILITTGIGAVVGVALEVAALTSGGLGIISKFIRRYLQIKEHKHSKLCILYDSKLNTISGYVSKALVDGSIDDQEFNLVLSELKKSEEMKKEIKTNFNKKYEGAMKPTLSEEEKKIIITKAREQLLEQLGGGKISV